MFRNKDLSRGGRESEFRLSNVADILADCSLAVAIRFCSSVNDRNVE